MKNFYYYSRNSIGRVLSLLMLLLCIVLGVKANPVDMIRAREIGAKFINANTAIKMASYSDLQLVTTYHTSNNDAAFHVFNTPKGFVIVSANDCATPILGYSEEGHFDMFNIPIQMQGYLQGFVEQIQYGIDNHLVADETIARQWELVQSTGFVTEQRATTVVTPLLTDSWGQGCYYNNLCPEDPDGPCGHVVTGCGATSFAQILHYWGYPSVGTGSYSYTPSGYPTQTVNFGATTYQWANMPNSLTSSSSAEQINAVATLMWHCGVAINMNYGPGSSGANPTMIHSALLNYFNYSSDQSFVYKSDFTDIEWLNMMKNSLNVGRPIQYNGWNSDSSSGHGFVCDGYDSNDMLHFNWGWYGSYNNYFAVDALYPGGYDFNYGNCAIINIHPNCASGSTYQVIATASPSYGGTVYGSDTYDCGGSCTLTAVPADGYMFCSWTEDGATVSNEPTYTFTVMGSRNIVANFVEVSGGSCVLEFTFNDSYGDGWNGNALVVNYSEGCNSYEELTLDNGLFGTMIRNVVDGCHIVLGWVTGGWPEECSFTVSYYGGDIIYSSSNPGSSFTYEFDVNCDGTTPTYYDITASAEPPQGGSVSGAGSFTYGEVCVLTAEANFGYTFTNWTKNGMTESTDPTYSFVVTEDAEYVANFSSNGGGNIVVIGDGTSTTYQFPVNSLYNYSFTEMIYSADEIGTSGMITSVGFHFNGANELNRSVVVFMKNVNKDFFESSSDYEEVSSADIVFTGTLESAAVDSWVTLVLDTPFAYDGTSNLMIAFDDNTGSWSSRYFYYTTAANMGLCYYNDNYNPDPYDLGSYSGSKTVSGNRPNVQLGIMPVGSSELTVNDGANTSSYIPVWGLWTDNDLQHEFVYSADELNAMSGGNITNMKFFSADNYENVSWNGSFQIYMKEIDATNISSFLGTDDATLVYEGSLGVTSHEMEIILTTPYTYHGGNLWVGVYYTCTTGYSSCYWLGESVTGSSIYARSGNGYTTNSANFLPKTTFHYSIGSTTNLVVNPNPIDLGYRPNNAWMRPLEVNIFNEGVETMVNNILVSNDDYFQLDLGNAVVPFVLSHNSGFDLSLGTVGTASGAVNANLIINYGNDEEAEYDVTAIAYNPVSPDVWELAQTVNSFPFTATLNSTNHPLYNNYRLPPIGIVDGADAVYKLVFTEDTYLNASVTNGEDGKVVLYPEDFQGIGGPDLGNSYTRPQVGGNNVPFVAMIGDTNSITTSTYFPYHTLWNNSIAENLFLASELTEAGVTSAPMTSLSWYVSSAASTLPQSGISIWMANVSDTELTATSHITNGMTLVYTGDNVPVPTVGWNEFVFNQSTFSWDGHSNVLIVCQRLNGAWQGSINWQTHNPGFVAMSYDYDDYEMYDMTNQTYTMYTSSTNRDNIIMKSEVGRGNRDDITYDFETGLDGWTVIDVNAEQGTWIHSSGNLGGYDYTTHAHSGTGFAMCYSYVDYLGAYNTDSYLVSPHKYSIADGSMLTFWADNANDNYPEDFTVCVATADNPTANDFTQVWSGGAKGRSNAKVNDRHSNNRFDNWRSHSIDLSAFAGQEVWIAFHDVNYDMYEIWIDDVTITNTGGGNGTISDLTVTPGIYYLVASSTSNEFTVTINTEEVPCPELATNPHPADAATEVGSFVNLSWDLDSRTTEYRLMFGTTYYCEETLVDWTDELSQHYLIYNLNNNTNYFWRVDQRNDGCPEGVMGQVWGFTTHLNVPLNLYAYDIINQGDDLTLSWDAPNDRSLLYYNIYQNYELIGSTYNTYYTISNLPYNIDPGYYFNVTAVYDEGESNFSNARWVRVTGEGTIEGYVYEQDGVTPIQGARVEFNGTGQIGGSYWYYYYTDENGHYSFNMVAGTYNGTATCMGYQGAQHGYFTITYNELTSNINFVMDELFNPVTEVVAEYYPDAENPESPYVKVFWGYDNPLNWLYYDDGVNVDAIGLTAGGSFYWGVMFPAGTFAGNSLKKVSMYDYSAHTGNIMIYQGGNSAPGTLLYIQPYTCTGSMDFVEWTLDVPISIDTSQHLWIVMNNDNGQYVASCCNSTDDPNGRWISLDGATWEDVASYGIIYTWMLRAYVANGTQGAYYASMDFAADVAPTRPASFVKDEMNNILSVSGNAFTHNVGLPTENVGNTRAFSHYRVYRTSAYNNGPYSADNTVLLADQVTDTLLLDVTWPEVEMGAYKYGVSCVYEGNRESQIVWDETNQQPSSVVMIEGNNRNAQISENFDNGLPDDWTTIDGGSPSGYGWQLASAKLGSFGYGHNGSDDCMISESYDNSFGVVYPDNYLITPQVPLGGIFSFWACAQDVAYAAEHFGLAVSTTNNTDASAFTTVQEWTMTAKTGNRFIKTEGMRNDGRGDFRDQGNWYYYEVDLSEFAGQNGYIAIRHFDCSDQFYLNVDDVEYLNSIQLARESQITWSNPISKDMMLGEDEVNITITLNDGDSPAGTLVRFINLNSGEQQLYPIADVILDGTGYYAWNSFRKGNYQMTIIKEGYETISEQVSIWDTTSLNYIMEEITQTPTNLYVSSTGWAKWNGVGNDLNQFTSSNSFSIDFENGIPEGWTIIDANGDGYTWTLTSDIPATWSYYTNLSLDWYHGGSNAICSGSYINGVGALTPDEYFVSPLMNLNYNSQLNFWVAATDGNYAADHFGVFVSTTGTDPTDFSCVQEWTLTAKKEGMVGGRASRNGNGLRLGNWYYYTVDLSNYVGQAYIALRHFNCSDQYIMCIDDVELTTSRNGGRHYEYNQVVLTDLQGNVLYSENTTNKYCQLPVNNLVEGQTYHCKVASVYSSGLTEWAEVDWVYQSCDNYEGASELDATTTGEGNLVSWTYPEFSESKNLDNREMWDLMATFNAAEVGQYGVAYDGNNFYTSNWGYSSAAHNFYKYDLQGNMLEGFEIANCGTLRGITFDGQYFYGVANSDMVYCVDLANHTLVSTFTCAYGTMRGITYDPVRDGFWVIGNWSGNLTLIDRTGAIVQVGPEPESASDLAYYKDENDVEHVFCFNNGDNGVYDYNIMTNTLDGSVFNFSSTPGFNSGSSGGCTVGNFNGKMAFIGDIQQDPNLIGIYELRDAIYAMSPIGAMVYRDNQLVGFTRDNSYLDEGNTSNHQYTIRVVYGGPAICPDNNIYYSMSCPQTVSIGGGDQITQVSNLAAGWNWWSTYIEQDGIDGLTMLEESLGTNGHQIKSQTDFVTNYGSMWFGMLGSIDNEETYMIDNTSSCQVVMTGVPVVPSDHPITVSGGWNWIGYPCTNTMSVSEAFSGYTPANGDQVKSQSDYAMYFSGMWIGQLQSIAPGTGLMYLSNNATSTTLVYPNGGRSTETPASPKAMHWTNDIHAYPHNMTVMAVVELDDVELTTDNYELSAFDANGECRGSAKLTYVEPLDRHVVFLTIAGNDAAELNFGLYNVETGREYFSGEEALVYVTNATIGNPEEPYVVRFRGTTGMEELDDRVQIFPNPVQAGERISILTTADSKHPIHVEIVNALGATVAYETSKETSASIVAPMTAGVYMLRIHIDGLGTCTKKLIIK